MPDQAKPRKGKGKKASDSTNSDRYALKGWGKGAEALMDLTCPSGQVCQVRRPGPIGLIAAGVIDNVDMLGSIVSNEHIDRVSGRAKTEAEQAEDAKAALADPEKLKAAVAMIDKIVLHVVVQPRLLPVPEEWEGDRNPDAAYIDMVEDEDKVFILQYVMGGQKDLATFRQEFGASVGSLASVPDLPEQAV